MRTTFTNIKELVQVRPPNTMYVQGDHMNELPTIKNAYLLIEDGIIKKFGSMSTYREENIGEIINAEGRTILPTWCDSHTHLVYAGSREKEFVDRINGLTYNEIAEKGGGILNSAKLLQETSEEDIYNQSKVRLEEVMRLGTGAIEIKSGYGLSTSGELKMLRVIKLLKESYTIPVKSTFLAAHAIPAEFKNRKSDYIDLVVNETLPKVAQEGLADYIDVFCETGYFSVEDTRRILEAGASYGLVPKIHVNQFSILGGVKAGVDCQALSVDHLELLDQNDINALKGTKTMPVALPTCSFFLSIPYTPARKIINAGLPLAIASDYNPGSAPSGNMNYVVSTASIKMKLTPEEAINAATINGAYAMGMENEVGSITRGKKANLIVTKPISSLSTLPYAFGSNLIDQVYISGVSVD